MTHLQPTHEEGKSKGTFLWSATNRSTAAREEVWGGGGHSVSQTEATFSVRIPGRYKILVFDKEIWTAESFWFQ